MPLSEEELRLLEQMERALVEEDPKFASTLRGTTLRRAARRRAIVAGIVFVAGIVLLMTGAVASLWWVGVIGFAVMVGAATVGLGAARGQQQVGADAEESEVSAGHHPSGFGVIDGGRKGRPRRQPKRHSGFMERMEDRWRRRRERGY